MTLYHTAIAVVILAAGEARRMGTTKQLLPWEDTTMLGHTIQTAMDSRADEVLVVVGAHAEAVSAEVQRFKATLVRNPDWKNGMGSSLKRALEYLSLSSANYAAVMIILADQPMVTVNYLNSMIFHFREGEKDIVATSYSGKAGVPALFGASHFKGLLGVDDGTGARTYLKVHARDTLMLNAGDTTIDIDTPSEYQAAKSAKRS